jgi:23S rRNA pseudouridine1911/1915/1917 synthase
MKNREIHKSYLALLDGIVSEDEGEIDAPLHRTAQSVILREVCTPDAPDADTALTRFRVLARGKAHTLVEASPITGRTHQLRVHFAYLGHPITGDDLYGTPSPLIPRHALHAYTLSFPHPKTEQTLTLRAPLPEDLRLALAQAFPDGAWKDAIPNS